MGISARSVYNKKTIKALTYANVCGKTKPAKKIILWAVIWFLIIAFSLVTYFLSKDIELLADFAIIIILGGFLQLYLYVLLPNIQYKSLCKQADLENIYIFSVRSIHITSRGNGIDGETYIEYEAIYKAMETSEYIFLYQNKMQAYAIDKSTVTGGSAEDIRKILSDRLGNKYIICKY